MENQLCHFGAEKLPLWNLKWFKQNWPKLDWIDFNLASFLSNLINSINVFDNHQDFQNGLKRSLHIDSELELSERG